MTVEAIPADPDAPYPLGRTIRNHDPRNWDWRALEGMRRMALRRQPWNRRQLAFDQGQTSSCTAHAAVGVLVTAPFGQSNPVRRHRRDFDTFEERVGLYHAAQLVDPWAGTPHDGSSTDAPFRVLRDRGVIVGWRWLFGEDDVYQWVRQHGPCAVGTDWTWDMFTPNLEGVITPTGANAGGHAYQIVGWSNQHNAYRIVNSWGAGWGDRGRAWITRDSLSLLLGRGGEAVTVG